MEIKISMLDKLTKLASTIPLIAVAIYIIGYVSLISYLQSYGISENIGLDFKVLKLGILLTIIWDWIVGVEDSVYLNQ